MTDLTPQFATPSETFENTKSSIYASADYNLRHNVVVEATPKISRLG